MVNEISKEEKLNSLESYNTDINNLVSKIEGYINTYTPHEVSYKEFYKEAVINSTTIKSKIETNTTSIVDMPLRVPLTFTAETANSSIGLKTNRSPVALTLEYQLITNDGVEGPWTSYTIGTTITLQNIGDSVRIRNTSTIPDGWKQDYDNYHQFVMSGKIRASGNIMYLFSKDGSGKTMPEYGCHYMYYNCTSLTSTPDLPATTLSRSCYSNMFYRCTSLTSTPELPATTLARSCYSGMFEYCPALTTAPVLPATTLADYCYSSMFQDCYSLTSAPELPVTTLTKACYSYMFCNCYKLASAPALPATTLTEECYAYMFHRCTSLTTAPALPAITLAKRCYSWMFTECSNLINVPDLPTTTLAEECCTYMFMDCTKLTNPPALPATTLAKYCYYSMFAHCTSLTNPPALPATTLAADCYKDMFYNCTSLTSAPELPATTLAESCYSGMLQDCRSLKVKDTADSSSTVFLRTPSTVPEYALYDMFTGTGGTFTGTASANSTYSWYR